MQGVVLSLKYIDHLSKVTSGFKIIFLINLREEAPKGNRPRIPSGGLITHLILEMHNKKENTPGGREKA